MSVSQLRWFSPVPNLREALANLAMRIDVDIRAVALSSSLNWIRCGAAFVEGGGQPSQRRCQRIDPS